MNRPFLPAKRVLYIFAGQPVTCTARLTLLGNRYRNQPTHETLFADVPNLSIENATKCLRIGSYGVAIGPRCAANLYKGELQ